MSLPNIFRLLRKISFKDWKYFIKNYRYSKRYVNRTSNINCVNLKKYGFYGIFSQELENYRKFKIQ